MLLVVHLTYGLLEFGAYRTREPRHCIPVWVIRYPHVLAPRGAHTRAHPDSRAHSLINGARSSAAQHSYLASELRSQKCVYTRCSEFRATRAPVGDGRPSQRHLSSGPLVFSYPHSHHRSIARPHQSITTRLRGLHLPYISGWALRISIWYTWMLSHRPTHTSSDYGCSSLRQVLSTTALCLQGDVN